MQNTILKALPVLRLSGLRGPLCQPFLFGRHWDGMTVDWRLPGGDTAPETPDRKHLEERVGRIALSSNFTQVYAPYTDKCSGMTARADDFTVPMPLGKVTLLRGPQADIVVAEKPMTVAFTTAGCAIIVAMDDTKVAVAHAGLRSLLSPNPTRTHTSVVKHLQNRFEKYAKLWVLFSVRPEHFVYSESDPHYGAINTQWRAAFAKDGCPDAMSAKGEIDLVAIIRWQAQKAGFLDRPLRTAESYLPADAYCRASEGRNLALFQIYV